MSIILRDYRHERSEPPFQPELADQIARSTAAMERRLRGEGNLADGDGRFLRYYLDEKKVAH